jgi:hypothetical protein
MYDGENRNCVAGKGEGVKMVADWKEIKYIAAVVERTKIDPLLTLFKSTFEL